MFARYLSNLALLRIQKIFPVIVHPLVSIIYMIRDLESEYLIINMLNVNIIQKDSFDLID